MRILREKSCGAVLFRETPEGERLFLLLQYPGRHWDFVKGHVEHGESGEQTMRRECEEETGITQLEVIPGFLQEIEFAYAFRGQKRFKVVHFYLAKTNEEKVRLSKEHSNYAWLPYDEAMKRVTFENARNVLRRAGEHLQALNK